MGIFFWPDFILDFLSCDRRDLIYFDAALAECFRAICSPVASHHSLRLIDSLPSLQTPQANGFLYVAK